ncbi:c-type cytochrome [Thermocrinis sp.]
MKGLLVYVFLLSIGFAKPEGQVVFENSCLRCHQPDSKKPLSYLQKKYKGKAQEVVELAKRCPWGRGLSDLEIELVSRWIAGD